MRSKILVLVTVVLSLLLAIGISTFAVSAEEAEPSVTIAKFNLAFEDNTYLKYAVRFDGVADSAITENNIGMLYWTDYEGGFVPGTENFSSKTTGYTDISGVKHYVFEYTRIAAMNLTDYIYSVAYVELDGTTYYSEPVKYSALEYAYNRLGKTNAGTTNTELKTLLNNMLAYGASAQQYFDYKEDRLATADFYQLTLVGGTLADGFTSGLYLATDKVTITAPEIDGKNFAGWQNENGETIYTENPATVENLTANTTLTATYEDAVKYSQGLAFTSNGDGTCYVSGIGTCKDTDIVIPPVSPEGDKVTSVGGYAFDHCTTLETIDIPNTVTNIEFRSFYACSNLTTIEIPDSVKNIGLETFVGCSSLESVVIPDSITSIGKSTFAGCTSLAIVEMPNSIKSIGDYAFVNCISLSNIKLPDSISNIGINAFEECKSLSEIAIPEGVTSIENHTFLGCTMLANITIPESVTVIGVCAFYGCSALETIIIPENVVDISQTAFYNCTSLKSITIPKTVTNIGFDTFYNCNLLKKIYYTGSEEDWNSISIGAESNKILSNATRYYYSETAPTHLGNYWHWVDGIPAIWFESPYSVGLEFKSNGDGTCYVSGIGTCNDVDIVIPPISPDGDTVTEIGTYAFENCKYVTSISISDNVTNIGDYAFYWCSSLVNIVIPDSVKSIGSEAFYYCKSLATISIGAGVTSISDNAFSSCSSLKNIEVAENNAVYMSIDGNLYTIIGECLIRYAIGKTEDAFIVPYGTTSIGNWAFANCSTLVSIVISSSVTSIGDRAFINCSSLKNIVVPDSVESIENYAFRHCSSLESVVIPDGITDISYSGLSGCKSLEYIVIPASITTIQSYAFDGCSSLKNVYYAGTKEEWATISIKSYNYSLTSATRYYYSETQPTTEGNFWHYDENGEIAIWPEYVAPDEPFEECNGFHYLGDVKVPKGLTEVYSKSEHPDIRAFADAPLSSEPTHAYYLCSKCGAVEDIMAIE